MHKEVGETVQATSGAEMTDECAQLSSDSEDRVKQEFSTQFYNDILYMV